MSDRPCHNCRLKWKDCPGFGYYRPGDIQSYCSHQILWLILSFLDLDQAGHLALLRYDWPPEDRDSSGYRLDSRVQASIKAHAGFERPLQEAAEVHGRLERTGKDGIMLLLSLQAGKSWRELSSPARSAALYCSGKSSRLTPYRTYKCTHKQFANVFMPSR